MNVLFVGQLKSKFIKDDFNILSMDNKVTNVKTIPLISKGIFNIFKYIKLAKENDVIYSWWLTSYSAVILGMLAKRKVVLVAGGFDCMKLPTIKYGIFTNCLKAIVVYFDVIFANHIIFVSKDLKKHFKKNCKIDIKNEVINLAISNKEWYDKGFKRLYDYITVTINVFDKNKMVRHLCKGVDLYVQHALKHPNKCYLLVGCSSLLLSNLEKEVPKNIICLKYLKSKDLLNIYNLSKTYIQSSRYESFGITPIEAKLCGCKVLLFNDVGILSEKGINIKDLTIENRRIKLNKMLNKLVMK
jgi:hypothetical protein